MDKWLLSAQMSVLYTCLTAVSIFIFPKIHLYSSDELELFLVVLCNLPFGMKVICSWLYGWRSVLILFPGAIFGDTAALVLFYDLSIFKLFLSITFGMIAVPTAFSVFAISGYDLRYPYVHNSAWLKIMLVGCCASFLNATFILLLCNLSYDSFGILLASQTLGMVVFFAGLMLVFKYYISPRNNRDHEDNAK